MQFMLELTRQCDLVCTHCLRGDAEDKNMPEHIMQRVYRNYGDIIDSLAFGGGESFINKDILQTFRDSLIYSDLNIKWFDPMWIVTNGLNLSKDEDILDLLLEIHITFGMPMTIAISTDKWHPKKSEVYFNIINDFFDPWDIEVIQYGPTYDSKLVSMGKTTSNNPIKLTEDDDYLVYVDVNGNMWPSCDLSYTFMDANIGSPIHLGNALTTTQSQLEGNIALFKDFLLKNNGELNLTNNTIYNGHTFISIGQNERYNQSISHTESRINTASS